MSPLQAVMFLIAVPAVGFCVVQLVREWREVNRIVRDVLDHD